MIYPILSTKKQTIKIIIEPFEKFLNATGLVTIPFLFCVTKKQIIKINMGSFEKFSNTIGLITNPHKSQIILGGVDNARNADNLAQTGFNEAALPSSTWRVHLS